MTDFSKKLKIIAKDTDNYLKNFLNRKSQGSYLLKPMKYGIFSGGKRFRSSNVVNTGSMFSINYKKLIIISAAVECIHSYSLIHDDLPAMDNDDLRRGMPSTHKKFSESTAILAGNSLLTLAFEILTSDDLKLSDNIKKKLVNSLAISSGCSGIAGGQYLDLNFEKKKILKHNIVDMQNKKTGKLFGFCCESIAIIKEFKNKQRKSLKELGTNIGLLFQVADDLIDYTGDRKIVGKPTKSDKRKGKANLVNILGYRQAYNFAENLKKKLNKKIKKYGTRSHNLLHSVNFILDRKF